MLTKTYPVGAEQVKDGSALRQELRAAEDLKVRVAMGAAAHMGNTSDQEEWL